MGDEDRKVWWGAGKGSLIKGRGVGLGSRVPAKC